MTQICNAQIGVHVGIFLADERGLRNLVLLTYLHKAPKLWTVGPPDRRPILVVVVNDTHVDQSMNETIQQILAIVSVTVAVSSLAFAIFGAISSGAIKRSRFGSFEIEATSQERKAAREFVASLTETAADQVPFETEQLALYYGQVLSQSKISFWFSLIFASLGFVVIIVSVFLYTEATVGATIAQVLAGIVVDAVAGLFFVQSRGAQKSMMAFFDKLRSDRQQLESRKLCDEIENKNARDALRINLSLHYAGVENPSDVSKTIISKIASNTTAKTNESAT